MEMYPIWQESAWFTSIKHAQYAPIDRLTTAIEEKKNPALCLSLRETDNVIQFYFLSHCIQNTMAF